MKTPTILGNQETQQQNNQEMGKWCEKAFFKRRNTSQSRDEKSLGITNYQGTAVNRNYKEKVLTRLWQNRSTNSLLVKMELV